MKLTKVRPGEYTSPNGYTITKQDGYWVTTRTDNDDFIDLTLTLKQARTDASGLPTIA